MEELATLQQDVENLLQESKLEDSQSPNQVVNLPRKGIFPDVMQASHNLRRKNYIGLDPRTFLKDNSSIFIRDCHFTELLPQRDKILFKGNELGDLVAVRNKIFFWECVGKGEMKPVGFDYYTNSEMSSDSSSSESEVNENILYDLLQDYKGKLIMDHDEEKHDESRDVDTFIKEWL